MLSSTVDEEEEYVHSRVTQNFYVDVTNSQMSMEELMNEIDTFVRGYILVTDVSVTEGTRYSDVDVDVSYTLHTLKYGDAEDQSDSIAKELDAQVFKPNNIIARRGRLSMTGA